MALDFTALNRIAYRGFETVEAQEQKDKLIDQGFTIVEGEELPFDEPPASTTKTPPAETTLLPSPAKVEIKQLFSLQDSALLCELYQDGRIELLEKLHIFKKTGAIYAHFMLTLEKPQKQASEAE